MGSDTDWEVGIVDLGSLISLEAAWRDLQSRSAYSFFQSWGWIGAWVETFPAGRMLLEVRYQGRVVGLSVLGRNTVTRSRVLASRALLVSEVGNPELDSITVEHSGILVERDFEADVVERALRFFDAMEGPWDELRVSGVARSNITPYLKAAEAVGLACDVRAQHPYFFVDCGLLRELETPYIRSLSANTRYQIRRSVRMYEVRDGVVRLDRAKDVDEALDYFSRLRAIHQECWEKRGGPGAFANDSIVRFHQTLIRRAFDYGEVQLLRISAGTNDFGYLYNFVTDGVVSNYQTGFRYDEDGRFKPGLVSHAQAIQFNVDNDARVYDLLMGDQRFKRSLAKNEAQMMWVALRRRGLRRNIGAGLRGVARLLTGR